MQDEENEKRTIAIGGEQRKWRLFSEEVNWER